MDDDRLARTPHSPTARPGRVTSPAVGLLCIGLAHSRPLVADRDGSARSWPIPTR